MKHIRLFESKGEYKVLGTNTSAWSWEYDSDTVTAEILTDDDNLYLKITKTHSKTGLGAGTKANQLEFLNIGTFKKADLKLVRTLLKKYGHERSRSGYPFSTFWEDEEGNKLNLSDLIKSNKPEQEMKYIKPISKFKEPVKETTDIELVKYSDKSYALFGEGTKRIKDELSALGCRYNRFLTDPNTGEKRPGWICAATKIEKVKELL